MKNFEMLLDKYADQIVKVGVNVQPKQTVVITIPVNHAHFARKIARKAYEAGAKHVIFDWMDDELTRMKFDLAPDEAFNEFPLWKAKGMEEMAEGGACFISVRSTNPDLLKGVNPDRISASNKAMGQAMFKFRTYTMSDRVSWTLIAAPEPEWAAMVFPNLPKSEQMDALWEAIFRATHVDQEDPIQVWREHATTLMQKADYLNSKKYRYLHYEAPGTKLTVELHPKHLWIGGGSKNAKGDAFMANMPTEEVFTAPLKSGINGVVSSTKPLSYQGSLIDKFSITFKEGRIVDFTAETGYEVLKRLVEIDEGAHYLGEVALVPHQSPISQSNLIFYNTLFDENASNHLAIGNAYSFNIEGGKTFTDEERDAHGLNTSLAHVDFMIGSEQMNVDGETADGKREPIFRNGNWAI